MKIINLSYRDKIKKWEFDKVEFSDLTLLVGASGTGKTQILQALMNLKKIVQGKSINGIQWEMKFELEECIYEWTGEFEVLEDIPNDGKNKKKKKPRILSESLKEKKRELISRKNDLITYRENKTKITSPDQSAIYLLKEERKIGNIYYLGFWDIKEVRCKDEKLEYLMLTKENKEYLPNNKSISNIRLLPNEIDTKLLLLSINDPDEFYIIKNKFISLFQQVSNLRISPLHPDEPDKYCIQIEEKSTEKWIPQAEMSSGMYRSLILIAELHLCQDNSVLLIDEVESGLDVNSIDALTHDMYHSKRGIQFILTSCHPYVISGIPYQAWKLVTRKEEKIIIKDTSEYKIYDSRQDAFRQLIQVSDS